jgi:alginate O-acetyltransferase complex protein AlgI
MIFNSFIFWIFFAIVLIIYWRLDRVKQNRLLLIASYTFYGYWDWRFCGLLAFSTTVDFFVAKMIHESPQQSKKKKILVISIVTNLLLLGFFKYYNFFSAQLAAVLETIGLPSSLPVLNVILPVGLSFYTFQSLSYTIDVYRGKAEPAKNILDLAAYVSFFPQLVAGPIERASHFLPQFLTPRSLAKEDFGIGLYHIMIGLFKKVVVADNLAPIANMIFSDSNTHMTGPEALIGIYAFAVQIYCDFSGYSSIAQGVAKWLGFDLRWNFKMPYFAVSPSDFWERWHISLSSWLRDYLYIPLGGNRHGKVMMYRNLVITMALGGLWHGARWTFVIWGLYHGIIQVVYRLIERENYHKHTSTMPFFSKFIKVFIMFHLVCLGWVFFRAGSLPQVWHILATILTNFQITHFALYGLGMLTFFSVPLLIYEAFIEKRKDLLFIPKVQWVYQAGIYSFIALMLIVFPPLLTQTFIYFQF